MTCLEDIRRELREKFNKLSQGRDEEDKTWMQITNDMVKFYIKKFERAELLTPLIPPEAIKKLETTHSPQEIKREAVKIVQPAIECMKKTTHPRWLIGRAIEDRINRALDRIRECRLIRPTDSFLEKKQEAACTFAVEEIRDMIHALYTTRLALADGCPVPNVSLNEADTRIATTLKDLDLARNLDMIKRIVRQNKEWLREKLEGMKGSSGQ